MKKKVLLCMAILVISTIGILKVNSTKRNMNSNLVKIEKSFAGDSEGTIKKENINTSRCPELVTCYGDGDNECTCPS